MILCGSRPQSGDHANPGGGETLISFLWLGQRLLHRAELFQGGFEAFDDPGGEFGGGEFPESGRGILPLIF